MITLLVNLKTANQKDADDLRVILKDLTSSTPKEKGCIEYRIYQESDNPLSFQILESWSSQKDLEKHEKNLKDSGLLEKAAVLMVGGLKQRVIEKI